MLRLIKLVRILIFNILQFNYIFWKPALYKFVSIENKLYAPPPPPFSEDQICSIVP